MKTKDRYLHNRRELALRLHSQYFGTYDYAESGQCAIAFSEIMRLLKCVTPTGIQRRWSAISGLPMSPSHLEDHARLCSEYWHALTTSTPTPAPR